MKDKILSFIKRRLQHNQKLLFKIKEKHSSDNLHTTYFAGYDLGYVEGKISGLEMVMDLLESMEEI